MREWLSTPVVATAGLAAATAAAIMLVFGLALALLTPANALTGGAGGSGLLVETLRLAVASTMTRFQYSGSGFLYLPLLAVAVPIAASAFGAARQARRTAHLPARTRVLAGAATGVPLALLVLVLGMLAHKDGIGVAPASAILFGLLTGGVGGLVGGARAVGPGSVAALTASLSAPVAHYVRLARTALKPLVLLLALMAVVGVGMWSVMAAREQSGALSGRSMAGALVENPLYAVEYGVGIAALAALGEVQPLGEGAGVRSTPLPLEDGGEFRGYGNSWRIFALADNYSVIVFVLLWIVVIGLLLALAGAAGFATAAAADARTDALGAAHGAIVGVTWAAAIVLLRAIGDMRWLSGGSVFVSVLLVTGAAGAVGGLMAARRPRGNGQLAGPAPT